MTLRVPAAALAVVLSLSLALPVSGAPLTFPGREVEGFETLPPPQVTAQAWLVYDESSDTILASQRAAEERPMASTTKIMTALVALENTDPSEMVTVSQQAADTGEREIELFAGEQFTLGALLKAALIHSANDAATAIAEHVGGTEDAFVEMMNEKAVEMALTETHFVNPHGLDHPEHYSSALDLLELAREAMKYAVFSNAVRSRILVFPDAPDGTVRRGEATNLLLHDYEGMAGVKTGFTFQAKLTMVASAEREGRRLYAVVLGSEGSRAHFADVRALFDWGFESLGIYGAVSTGQPFVASKARVETSPLVGTVNTETFMHLAAQGLMTSPPAPLVALAEPAPPPTITVQRYPEPPATPWDAASYWWELIMGES